MATKYWKMNIAGVRSMEEINSVIGRSGANLVRVHFEGGQTQVYVAADELVGHQVTEALKGAVEVTAENVGNLA